MIDLADLGDKQPKPILRRRLYRKKIGLAEKMAVMGSVRKKIDRIDATATMRDGENGTPSSADSPVGQSLKLLTEIQAAIRAGDLKTIRRTADALKSSITSVLAKEAFLAASALENTVREDDLANAQDACRRLRDALASLNPPTEEKTENQ